MASFDQHLTQAKSNLSFLKDISDRSKYFDWQVTSCFYVAVHLINAHLAKCADLHYKTHKETKMAISPDNSLSTCKFTEEIFDTYVSLEKLSRRSRYLCNDNPSRNENPGLSFLTNEKHVSRAMSRLSKIMVYFNSIHQSTFEKTSITCPKVKAELPKSLQYFVA